jgi:hypothetical protein
MPLQLQLLVLFGILGLLLLGPRKSRMPRPLAAMVGVAFLIFLVLVFTTSIWWAIVGMLTQS